MRNDEEYKMTIVYEDFVGIWGRVLPFALSVIIIKAKNKTRPLCV